MGILFIILGVVITYAGYKIVDNRKKYEFNNRTDGGTVQFKNWKATKRHSFLMNIGKLMGVAGIFLCLFAAIYLVLTNR